MIAGIWNRQGTLLVVSNTAEVPNYVVTGGTTDPPYGWTHQVTSGNTNLAVTTKLGNAQDTIAGHTLLQIVTNANVKVRADNKACQECHSPTGIMPAWNAATIDKASFCNNHVASFNASASKPQILKDLFNNWKGRNCPD